MWSVDISVSPCRDATRMGYDERQINRIVIRMAQYFLDRNMRVIFGHDWHEDGVMRAIADFAEVVAAGNETRDEGLNDAVSIGILNMDDMDDVPMHVVYQTVGTGRASVEPAPRENPRMLNVVPTKRESLSRAALEAKRSSGGVLEVLSLDEGIDHVLDLMPEASSRYRELSEAEGRPAELTTLRHCMTDLLNPGCRICLGGETCGYEGNEPAVMEEARLALRYHKPLFLMGGFGGATQEFGENEQHWRAYEESTNGLTGEQSQALFETTDIERAVRLIASGIKRIDGESNLRFVDHSASPIL